MSLYTDNHIFTQTQTSADTTFILTKSKIHPEPKPNQWLAFWSIYFLVPKMVPPTMQA